MVIVRPQPGEQLRPPRIAWRRLARFRTPTTRTRLAKAGRTRWLGKRPLTRGVAKNLVDHPHGGGEGRTSGRHWLTRPVGKLTKGARTRHNKSTGQDDHPSRHARKASAMARPSERPVRRAALKGGSGAGSHSLLADQDLVTASLDDPAAVRRPGFNRSITAASLCRCRSTKTWSV
jgi:hypothetical protein